MILFCNFSVPDHDQCDLTVQISQNIQPLRQRLALNLDQILAAVFLAFHRLQQCYRLRLGVQFQQSLDVHSLSRRNMIDHNTILNGFYV